MAAQNRRVELKGSHRPAFAHATPLTPAAAAGTIHVTVCLRRGSPPEEFSFDVARAHGRFAERRYLTRTEFARKHGARDADVALIHKFAAENSLEVVRSEPARRTVLLRGRVAAFVKAFNAQLYHASISGGVYRVRSGPLDVPAELENVVEGIFGLDNRPQAKPHFRRHVHPRATSISYTTLEVAQAYDFPAGANGAGQAIGIIELGGGYTAQDLSAYFGVLNISVPSVTAIPVDGASNSPTGDPDGPDGEVQLDIEVAGSIAPSAKIGVYFAPNTDQGFIDAVTTAVHDANLNPSIISISWGGAENTWTEQARDSLNSACEDASIMGVTIFVASGDGGATDGSADGSLEVDFPSSSPFVTGCGGTKLILQGASIGSETVWNELSSDEGASGGGVSEAFPLPSFQANAGVPLAPNKFKGRGVPDVSGDADPASGYQVVVDGASTVIGGTSAVAPLWAGLVARINPSLGKPVGYLNPLIYGPREAATFHDITSGNNDGYSAGKGWDACTGLGSPDGAALLAALAAAGGAPASS